MPYKSDAQRKLFHAKEKTGEISPAVVKEFDQASKGKHLQAYVKAKKARKKHYYAGGAKSKTA